MQRTSCDRLQEIVEIVKQALGNGLFMTTDEAIEQGLVVPEELADGSPVDDIHLHGVAVSEQTTLWLPSGSLLVLRELDCPESFSPSPDDLWSEVDAEDRGQHGQCLWAMGNGASNVTGQQIDFLHAIVRRDGCCHELVLYSEESRREVALSIGLVDDEGDGPSEADRIIAALRR